jgi:tetratricopeptide (TPR) repeat protein
MAAAHAAFAARRDDEAQAAFEQLVTVNPQNHEAVYYLGRLAKRRGDWQAVAARYERCTQLAPSNALYWADLGEAYGKLAGKAGLFRQLGLARKCRTALEKAVELEPENLDYRFGLIQFYEKAPAIVGGGRDKALGQAAEIAKRDPFAGMMETGAIHSRGKNVALAETAFREAAKLHPDAVEPLAALGLLYADAGQFPEAFAQFDALLARDHDNFAALYQLGRVAALSGERLVDGEAALRRYLEQPNHPPGQPTNAHAQLRLGNIAERRGDRSGARAAYEAALRLDPGLKPAAEALQKLGP